MAELSEYLGGVVSSITHARVLSDLQAVKIAEEYGKHDLLQYLSIPRMRIQDVELTIPVALDSTTERVETVFEPIDNVKFNSLAYKEAVNSLGLKRLSAKASQSLRTEIAKMTVVLESQLRITKDLEVLDVFVKDLLHTIISIQYPRSKEMQVSTSTEVDEQAHEEVIKERSASSQIQSSSMESLVADYEKLPPHFNFDRAKETLKASLRTELSISSQKRALDTLDFMVESSKLREQKPEHIIYIKMRITEEGMEWHTSENSNGEIQKRLHLE